MTEQQKLLVTELNDMYHSQSNEYKSRYRDNYFELLQHIIAPRAYISGEDFIAPASRISRILEEENKQEDSV